MTGPETKPGWRLVHNPIAVVAGLDTIDVYARGAGDQLRRWRMKADILGEPEYLGMVVKGGLAAIYEVGVPDVFACGSDGPPRPLRAAQRRRGSRGLGGSRRRL